jgi:RHS repeat-associated protein
MEYQFDAGGNVTNTTTRAGGVVRSASFLYDGMGRRVQATLADGGVVRYDYEPTGELAAQAGAQTYPVQYEYDSLGRMAALSTFREGEGGTPDVTRWLYDDRRGWVSAKVYADGTTNRYEYRQDGRLARRVSARGIETRYGYDAGGVVTNTGYSDGTPGVSVGLDRLGRAVEVGDALGVRSLRYDATGALVEEMLPGEVGKLEYAQDAIGRRTNMVAGSYGVGYRYDAAGRLAGVSSSGMRATYEYANDGVSVATVRLTGNDEEVLRGVREYDEVGALKRISWVAGTNEVTGREYEVNAVGQRVRCAMGDGTYWMYEYDEAGQLKTARKCTADGQQVPGCNHAYTYDGIGNRQSATLNDVEMKYEANGLNQYVSYEKAAEAPKWQGTLFIIGGGGSWKGFGLNGRRCLYDADGNLANDGEWAYAWDAENRLMMASNATTVVRNKYDYMSRRIMKQVYTKAVDVWQLTSDSRFTYDGWSMLSEICHLPSEMRTNVSWFVWGLDLSGTLGGAGGIGGLLYANADPLPGGAGGGFFYAHDGNGNVTALVDTNGSVVVAYEYDPYGKLLSTINHTPLTILENPYTFSTKYRDDETGLSYYGYRFYSAALGRWLNRDPMEEGGGVNLYGFVRNAPPNAVDSLGLALYAFDGTANVPDDETNIYLTQASGWDGKNKRYERGIGNEEEFSALSAVLRQATGLGLSAKRSSMLKVMERFLEAGDIDVDVIGFSRGAVTAITFGEAVQKLKKEGVFPYCQVDRIRFMGLYDPVPGPFIRHRPVIPDIVKRTAIAYSLDEKRKQFAPSVYAGGNVTALGFRGGHSDVGGGYDERGFANISLEWMIDQGLAAGAPFKYPTTSKSPRMIRHQEINYDLFLYANRNGLGGIQPHASVSRLISGPVNKIVRTPRFGVDVTPYTYYLDSVAPGNDEYRIGDRRF